VFIERHRNEVLKIEEICETEIPVLILTAKEIKLFGKARRCKLCKSRFSEANKKYTTTIT
jgi:hypothetical protein